MTGGYCHPFIWLRSVFVWSRRFKDEVVRYCQPRDGTTTQLRAMSPEAAPELCARIATRRAAPAGLDERRHGGIGVDGENEQSTLEHDLRLFKDAWTESVNAQNQYDGSIRISFHDEFLPLAISNIRATELDALCSCCAAKSISQPLFAALHEIYVLDINLGGRCLEL